MKADDYELAKNFIEQKDCQNALPILISTFKTQPRSKQKEILLSISLCAEETSDLVLKKKAEQALLKIEPNNVVLQLRYLETLFYLSSYREILNFAKKKKEMRSTPDFWLSIGRTYFELSSYERSLNALNKYLNLTDTNKSEAYYWIAKNYMEQEEYSKAIDHFNMALSPQFAVRSWVKQNATELIEVAKNKNKSYKARLKLSYGYDTNIARDNEKSNDSLSSIDIYQDYYLVRKKKLQLNLGFDLSYQGYAINKDYKNSSANLRIDYFQVLKDDLSHGFSISGGKIQSNFKADQNYTFSSYFLTYGVSKSIELQPSIVYFANLNNTPIQQMSYSLSTYYYLDADYMWVTPFYRKSFSPDPVFAVSGTNPYIAEFSTTGNYGQTGLILGYQKTLSDVIGATFQYSYAVTQFDQYSLSAYPAASVKDAEARKDIQQSLKVALQYRQTPTVRWTFSTSSIFNTSKGFQGFASTTPGSAPDANANYDQNLTSLGVTLDWP
ncbi:MAG: hypothetical protein H7328_13650 [Bdellovibrio sp.]|nr:hypothetical protein [Bdellovibrio sp.]